MRKIHVIRKFLVANGRHVNFFEKTKKNTFLDKVNGSMCTEFQVCIVFRLVKRTDTIQHIYTPTYILANKKTSCYFDLIICFKIENRKKIGLFYL